MNMMGKCDLPVMNKQAKTPAISPAVKIIAIISLVAYAGLELFFTKLSTHPIGLAAPCILILFGIWRIENEKDRFQRLRIIVIVSTFAFFWVIIPLGFKVQVPALGGEWGQFPAIHHVGSLMFFLYFALILLFGKRIDCGWCCPCVTVRETIGYPFRDKTPRSHFWWRLRWLKFVLLGLLVVYLGFMIYDAQTAYARAGKFYYDFITYTYYGSFLLIPLTGNRNFCRILCPYAALWGTLSFAGLFRIKAKQELCTGCKKCESVCDMGIPIARLVRERGEVRTVECMGCNRCVGVCPTKALSSYSLLEAIVKRLRARGQFKRASQ